MTHKIAVIAMRASLLLSVVGSAAAQDVPFVFQHGVLSNGATWDFFADTLRRQLRIVPVKPSLNWTLELETQAAQLSQQLNGNTVTASWTVLPFSAHSLGGLVAREYNKVPGTKLNRLVTIATPHTGAPVADSWWNGLVLAYGGQLGRAIRDPLLFYDQNDWGMVPGFIYDYAGALNNFARDLSGWMCPIAGLCVHATTYLAAPFVAQTLTTSPYLAGLNGQYNLGREVGAIPHRFGRSTSTWPVNALFRLLTGDSRRLRDVRNLAIAMYHMEYQHYVDSDDPWLREHAYLWTNGEVAMIDIDVNWLRLIGGNPQNYRRVQSPGTGIWSIHVEADPNDGLLPAQSVTWQNADNQQVLGNIGHTDQTKSPQVRDAVRTIALSSFGIVSRPPGSVYTVAVNPGTTAVTAGGTTQLSAVAYDVNGALLSGKTFTWATANAGVAIVSSTGVVTGVAAGTTTIAASSEGYTGSAYVSVGALTASVSDPASVRSGATCTWYAQVTYGAAPYTYSWKVGTKPQPSTTEAMTYRNLGAAFTVYVTVTDTFGTQTTASRLVTISSGASMCS